MRGELDFSARVENTGHANPTHILQAKCKLSRIATPLSGICQALEGLIESKHFLIRCLYI